MIVGASCKIELWHPLNMKQPGPQSSKASAVWPLLRSGFIVDLLIEKSTLAIANRWLDIGVETLTGKVKPVELSVYAAGAILKHRAFAARLWYILCSATIIPAPIVLDPAC